MKLLLDSHVPADVAAAVLKLQPSWSVEHVSSWQEGPDFHLDFAHQDHVMRWQGPLQA